MAVDSAGSAYVTGYTTSTDFPTLNPIQALFGGGFDDAFLTKFTPAGSGLVYSTYLGGDLYDEALGIALDGGGNAYLAGTTQSANYPLANAYQGQLRGGVDAFVTKVNAAGSALVYSTFLGGNSQDQAGGYPVTNQSGNVIAVDAAGEAFVAGSTTSADFPLVNAFQGQRGSNFEPDAFLTKFNAAGSALVYFDVPGRQRPRKRPCRRGGLVGLCLPGRLHPVEQLPGGKSAVRHLAGRTRCLRDQIQPRWGDGRLVDLPGRHPIGLRAGSGGGCGQQCLPGGPGAIGQLSGGGHANPAGVSRADRCFHRQDFDPLRSPTPTVTGTPPTNTPTRTPTNTATWTLTRTPTITLTPTVTRTPTRTRTPTVTGTPPTATPTPTSAPGCAPTWAPVAYPGGPGGAVYNVYAAGATDAWASSAAGMLRWNGSQWSSYALPSGVGPLGPLGGSATNDVWGLASASAARWDGSAWHAVPFPRLIRTIPIATPPSTPGRPTMPGWWGTRNGATWIGIPRW